MAVVWQLAEAERGVSAARGRLSGILPLASGWAPSRAKALLAKVAELLLLAKVALRLPASKALS